MDKPRTDRIVKTWPSHDKSDLDGAIIDFGGEIPLVERTISTRPPIVAKFEVNVVG
jgi:hypothetical protein